MIYIESSNVFIAKKQAMYFQVAFNCDKNKRDNFHLHTTLYFQSPGQFQSYNRNRIIKTYVDIYGGILDQSTSSGKCGHSLNMVF